MSFFTKLITLPVAIAVDVVKAPLKIMSASVDGEMPDDVFENTEKILHDKEGE